MLFRMPFCERDLARARQILNSWTKESGRKRLSSDEADTIVRMIAQGIAGGRREGLEMAAGLNANQGGLRGTGTGAFSTDCLDERKNDLGAKL
jgi:hypothetical protein